MMFKNTLTNVPLISLIFSLISTYVCYKPKELLAEIYELNYQAEFLKSQNPDIMGNIKDIKRIELFDKKDKSPKF
jgi:hypothetical protein